MNSQSCIIVGMGHAAAQLAPSLRQSGWDGKIIMIGNEGVLPYHRPPLSKDYLQEGEEAASLIRSAEAYEKLDVKCHTNKSVISVDSQLRNIKLESGEQLSYDKLILATGGRVRKLLMPGSDLGNIFYLRNFADAMAIKKCIRPGGKVVVIGGGYIGLEIAASLTKHKMSVTVLEAADRVLQRVTSPEVSAFIHRYHTEQGVEILTNKKSTAFAGNDKVEQVLCEDGSIYPADFVVVGVGIIPNTDLAESAGLALGDGVLVNEYGQTSDQNIYAVGDCSNHPNEFYQKRLRLESVPNAMDQSRSVAAHICGQLKPYTATPWFWSNQFDLKWQIAGLSEGYDEVLLRGNPEDDSSFVAWYLKDGTLIAADCINRPKEFMAAKKLIGEDVIIPSKDLTDENVSPKEWMKLLRK